MRKIEVEFFNEAVDEWNNLNSIVEIELKNNITKSEKQTLLSL